MRGSPPGHFVPGAAHDESGRSSTLILATLLSANLSDERIVLILTRIPRSGVS
jgi:hypothetical protein